MSSEARQWAFDRDIKPSSVKFVLVALGDIAQSDEVWPSIAALVQKTAQDRKTVMAALDKLEAAGYLTDTKKRTGSTGQIKVYKFNFAHANSTANGIVNVKASGTVPDFPIKNTENGTVNEVDEEVDKEVDKAVETVPLFPETVPDFPGNGTVFPPKSTENGTRNRKEPTGTVKEPKKNKRAKNESLADLLDAGVDEQTATDWLQHRKTKRASTSRTVLDARMAQARLAGLSLCDALRTEVSRGWQGFEASWLQKQARGSPGYQTANEKQKAFADRLTGKTRHEQPPEFIDLN
jgi:hypothetical protein